MIGLSLWQPWATLVVVTQKHETRSWPTKYRGDVLICSTSRTAPAVFSEATTRPEIYERMRYALFASVRQNPESGWSFPTTYPDGAALGVVELWDCLPAEEWKRAADEAEQHHEIEAQRAMGDIDSPGRWIWLFRNRRILSTPVPIKGGQRLWNVAPAEIEQIAPLMIGLEGRPCYVCREPATCVGRHEGSKRYDFGCDRHCGHGHEDGRCYPLTAVPACS